MVPALFAGWGKAAFMCDRSGHTEIWISDAAGSHLMPLTSMGTLGTFAGMPRLSRDGLDIALMVVLKAIRTFME